MLLPDTIEILFISYKLGSSSTCKISAFQRHDITTTTPHPPAHLSWAADGPDDVQPGVPLLSHHSTAASCLPAQPYCWLTQLRPASQLHWNLGLSASSRHSTSYLCSVVKTVLSVIFRTNESMRPFTNWSLYYCSLQKADIYFSVFVL